MTSPSLFDLERARSSEDVARIVVESGVAHACAAGWARREGARFVVETGGFVREGEGAPLLVTDPARIVFDLASLTKPLLAAAFVESGLEPGTPLGEALHEVNGTRSASVPLEVLLAHRAGLEANLPLFKRLLELPHERRAEAREALLAEAADARRGECSGERPPEGFPPLYSDLGYVLVGEALARLDRSPGQAPKDAGLVMHERVVRKLGLESSLGTARELALHGVDVERRAAPTEDVEWRGGVVRGRVHDENAWMLTGTGGSGHAGMFGTVSAMLSFGQYVLEEIERFEWTHRPRTGGTLRAGFDGKSEEGSSAGARIGERAFGHLGFTGTSIWIDPDAHVVVSLLTNRVYPTRESGAIRTARPLAHDALYALATRAPHG